MAIQYIDSEMMEVEGKRVIARFDFNVPLDKSTGKITDTTRLDRALPTIQYILGHNLTNFIFVTY